MASKTGLIMKNTLVMKFGGTSVGSIDALKLVKSITQTAIRDWEHVIIVTSAFCGVTNDLITSAISAANGDLEPYKNTLKELRQRHILALDAFCSIDTADIKIAKIDLEQLIDQFSQLVLAIAAIGESSPRALDAVASLGERMSVCVLTTLLKVSEHSCGSNQRY